METRHVPALTDGAETSVVMKVKSVAMVFVGLNTSVVTTGTYPAQPNAAMTNVAHQLTSVVMMILVARQKAVVAAGQKSAQLNAVMMSVAIKVKNVVMGNVGSLPSVVMERQ